jgi:hypothetical protein
MQYRYHLSLELYLRIKYFPPPCILLNQLASPYCVVNSYLPETFKTRISVRGRMVAIYRTLLFKNSFELHVQHQERALSRSYMSVHDHIHAPCFQYKIGSLRDRSQRKTAFYERIRSKTEIVYRDKK